MRMDPQRQPIGLLATGFVILWNSGFIGAEYALPHTRPLSLLFWRYWALVLVLLGWLIWRRRLAWPGWRAAATAGLVGVLSHAVWLGCVFYSLAYGVPAGIVALVVALQPLATAAFSGVVVGERTPLVRWVGLLIGLGGVLVAVLARTDLGDAGSLLAFFLPFGSVVAITAASLIQRRTEVRGGVGRLGVDVALFYQSLGAVLAVTVPAADLEGLAVEWTPVFVGAMLWLILGVSLMAYALMWMLIARMDATRVASLFYFGPPVTMVMAWMAFGDRILVTDLVGLGVIAVGVLLAQRERRPGGRTG